MATTNPPRVFSVVTNLRCNQRCLWCTRRGEKDDPRFIAAGAVRARIEQALAAGSDEIVLTGGEPGMRGDLEALIRPPPLLLLSCLGLGAFPQLVRRGAGDRAPFSVPPEPGELAHESGELLFRAIGKRKRAPARRPRPKRRTAVR